ncbi:hypothetical protein V8B97DRAFT_2004754 [Scleroderma yunnanense]
MQPEKKRKIYYDHGKDGLGLALSIAETEEERVSRRVEKHRQMQVVPARSGQHCEGTSIRRPRSHPHGLGYIKEETKAMIAKQRARAKKEKAKSRKDRPKGRNDHVSASKPAATRKRVSFA